MNKKLIIGMALVLSIILSFTVCFANDELQKAADSVRNVVGGDENVVEDAARGVSNAAKDATNNVEKGANNAGNEVKNSVNKAGSNIKNAANNIGNAVTGTSNNYTATRTSADNTFMGMNSTAWTWLILGIAAIAIIALVWYYSSQLNNNDNRHE